MRIKRIKSPYERRVHTKAIEMDRKGIKLYGVWTFRYARQHNYISADNFLTFNGLEALRQLDI